MDIPIIFAINDDYVKQLATTISSIMRNSNKENNYNFFVLSTDVSAQNKSILLSYVKKIGAKLNFIDMKPVIKNIDLEKLMSRRKNYNYISPETYFRYFIPELFSEYEKVLYLDADILVANDLSILFSEDIADTYSGVIKDSFLVNSIQDENFKTQQYPELSYRQYLKKILKKKNRDYFNAGVLLLNLARIRNDKIISKLWDFTIENSPLEFQDQDALNAVFESNVKFLDIRWNVLKNWQKLSNDKKQKNPYIIHYVGENKPWVYNKKYSYDYPMIKEWWNIYKQTPFYKEEETKLEKKILNKVKLYKVKHFLQQIFLLRNDGIYKEVRFMGIVFRFKRKMKNKITKKEQV